MAERPLKLDEIAARIGQHLTRFANNRTIARSVSGHSLYWHPVVWRGGARVKLRYVAYQGDWSMTRDEAVAYLAWLDAGHVGKHWEMKREAGDA